MADADMAVTASSLPETPMSSCPFQKVPLEVLLRISSQLDTPSLGSLRLTCRSIEQFLYISFTKEFFTRKQFMTSDISLQALVDISKSRLSDNLRKVHFGLDHFPNAFSNQRDLEMDMKAIDYHAGMFTLWSTGYHRDMIAEAFANLKNLEDVVIRDFNSSKRTRDGEHAQWNSYGAPTASSETAIRITQGDDSVPSFCSQVFAVVLAALGQAKARPQGIEVMSRRRNPLKNYAFNIPPYLEPSVAPVLENLAKLHIDVGLGLDISFMRGGPGARQTPPGHWEGTSVMLRKFLLKTHNVKHLRINETRSHESGAGALLEWLALPSTATPTSTSPLIPAIPSPALAHLEELNLGQMNVEASGVLNLIRKVAPTIKRLEIWKLTLVRELQGDQASTKVSFWNKFFHQLREIPDLELRHIKLGCLDQLWRGKTAKSSVLFDRSNPTSSVVSYTGPDWKHFMGEVITNMLTNFANSLHVRELSGLDDDSESDGIWDLYALDL
ncbi:hypothetical protein AK830_g7759 [Neonectria ditissima]|uniref:F-box domain-containing protein n=1 Tax=Neonectria ditissima TaxID=78410 RepID=A0A0P7B9G1_9HYPO|nr:hypothetical protein AK830_g7759 [Neonectria ditissima]